MLDTGFSKLTALSIKLQDSQGNGASAVYEIDVVDFPAFILVDDKGNDFFKQLPYRAQDTQCT